MAFQGALKRHLLLFVVIQNTIRGSSPLEHRCVHETHTLPFLSSLSEEFDGIPEEAHRSASGWRRQAMEESPGPLRVHLDFQVDSLGAAEASLVRDRLIPTTLTAMTDVINVKKPILGPLFLDRFCNRAYESGECAGVSDFGYCGHAEHDPDYFGNYTLWRPGLRGSLRSQEFTGGTGVSDADIVLYVTAVESTSCQASLAQGGPCKFDAVTHRPTAGYINFCPSKLVEDGLIASNWPHWVQVTAHELTHVLVLSSSLFGRYIDEGGEILGEENVARTAQHQDGHEVLMVVTPAVTAAARDHLGCDSLQGAELESDGGEMTSGNHWENRIFEDELMTGDLSTVRSHVLSSLTLALYEDSGWYDVNHSKASARPFAKGAGCGFADMRCSESAFSSVYEPWFCQADNQANQQGCNWDHRARGYCEDRDGDECGVSRAFLNGDCMDESTITTRTEFWGESRGEGVRCIPDGTQDWSRDNGDNNIYSRTPGGGTCLKTRCERDEGSSAAWRLFVEVGGKEMECTEGEVVEVWTDQDVDSTWNFASVGPCPSAASVCSRNTCPDDCHARGVCLDGVCSCYLGYRGVNCSECMSDYCPCSTHGTCGNGTHCDFPTGECLPGPAPIPFDALEEVAPSAARANDATLLNMLLLAVASFVILFS